MLSLIWAPVPLWNYVGHQSPNKATKPFVRQSVKDWVAEGIYHDASDSHLFYHERWIRIDSFPYQENEVGVQLITNALDKAHTVVRARALLPSFPVDLLIFWTDLEEIVNRITLMKTIAINGITMQVPKVILNRTAAAFSL